MKALWSDFIALCDCGGREAGSASEITVAPRISVAKRYITAADYAEADVLLDRVRAMLWRLTH